LLTAMIALASLKDSPLFIDLSDADIEILGGFFNVKELAEGMTIFVENMPGESLYLIQQGVVKISKMLAEGEEKILVVLGAEDIFGELAILDGAPRLATARVAEKARLLSIRKTDYESLCEQHPRLALKVTRNIVRVLSRRIREKDDDYMDMLSLASGKQA
jgi:CRP/FNR family transcriptional regulator, cyclic AMP receptor protein